MAKGLKVWVVLSFFGTAPLPSPNTQKPTFYAALWNSKLSWLPSVLSQASMLFFSIYHRLKRDRIASSPPGYCSTRPPYSDKVVSLRTHLPASDLSHNFFGFLPIKSLTGVLPSESNCTVSGTVRKEEWQKGKNSLLLYSSAWEPGTEKPAQVHLYVWFCPQASEARHLPAKSQVKIDKGRGVRWKWMKHRLRSRDLGYHLPQTTNLWCHRPQNEVQASRSSMQGPAWPRCCFPLQPHLLPIALSSIPATLLPFRTTPPSPLPHPLSQARTHTHTLSTPTTLDNWKFSNASCCFWLQFLCTYYFFCPLHTPTPQTVFEHQLGSRHRGKRHSSCSHELIRAPYSFSLPSFSLSPHLLGESLSIVQNLVLTPLSLGYSPLRPEQELTLMSVLPLYVAHLTKWSSLPSRVWVLRTLQRRARYKIPICFTPNG